MNISLTPQLQAFVDRKVKTGLYQTASEVVREGLRLLRERDELQQTALANLRREIALGIEEAVQGKLAPLNAKDMLAQMRKNRRSHPGKKNG